MHVAGAAPEGQLAAAPEPGGAEGRVPISTAALSYFKRRAHGRRRSQPWRPEHRCAPVGPRLTGPRHRAGALDLPFPPTEPASQRLAAWSNSVAVSARHIGPLGPTSRARGCSPGGVASLGTLDQVATSLCVLSRPSRYSSSRLWVCLLSAIADSPASCHCTLPSRTKTTTTVASDGARASHRMRRSISRDTAAPRRVAPARSGQRVRCRPYTCPPSCRA